MAMDFGTILIVEDDFAIRESLREFLSLEGYSVEVATDGRNALGVLNQIVAPSIILLDLMMPVMSGQEFLEELRKDPRYAPVPVLVLSAVGHLTKVELANGFIKKPIDLMALLNNIKKLCDPRAVVSKWQTKVSA